MRGRIACAAALAGAAVIAVTPALGAAPQAQQIDICHATASAKNPYVLIHPAAAGVVNGHAGHQDQRDFIPSFTYKGGFFAGQHYDAAGEKFVTGGCKGTPPPLDGGGGTGGVF